MRKQLQTAIFIMLIFAATLCRSQSIYFNERGQVYGTLPNKLETGSKITFQVNGKDFDAEEKKKFSRRPQPARKGFLHLKKMRNLCSF